MHQIAIRLLLGIVITVSQYKTQTSADCGGFRRMSTTVNCIRVPKKVNLIRFTFFESTIK